MLLSDSMYKDTTHLQLGRQPFSVWTTSIGGLDDDKDLHYHPG
jgi:hypothetical protein